MKTSVSFILIVAAAAIALSCKNATETDPIAPGMRATIDGVHWSSDSTFAVRPADPSSCMLIYGFGFNPAKTILLQCQSRIKSGDTAFKNCTYTTAGVRAPFDADSGYVTILKVTDSRIEGTFHYLEISKRNEPVTIEQGEFNIPFWNGE